jgi:cupin 2 domain-containing protein
MEIKNIFSELPDVIKDEVFETLIEKHDIRIERIISNGQPSPEGFWYDQDIDEWVILLSGSAALLFEENTEEKILLPGDFVFIPAHLKHRVNRTSKEQKTIWLSILFK